MWRRTWLTMSLSAACAICAVWSKQSVLPFVIVPPLFVLIVDGTRNAVRYGVLLGAIGLVISASLALSFGASNMWFHMVTLSAGHAWRGAADLGKFWAMWAGIQDLVVDLIPTLVMLAGLFMTQRYLLPEPRIRDLRAWCRRNPWIMLVGTAIILIPSALLGYVKIGGYVNNFSLAHFFLAMLVAIGLIRLFERAMVESIELRPLAAFLLALTCLGALWPIPEQFLLKRVQEENFIVIAKARDNEQEAIFNFAKKNPGLGYFPWNNLSTLLADGKLYHFAWGYIDREEAHLLPSHEQIRRHLPEKVQVIGFGPRRQDEFTLKFLPPTQYKGTQDQLPGFALYIYAEPLKEGGW